MPFARRLMPTIAELAAFEAAARHGSFTRAAEELALTQGAVSKQVRQLEATLGVPLFERVKRQVVLTDGGRRYLADVRDTLARLERSTHGLIAGGGAAQTLSIASLPTFATRWLVPRLPRFLATRPQVALAIATRLRPFSFAEEPFDLAVHYGAPRWPGAEATHLFDEDLVPVASPGYRDRLALDGPPMPGRPASEPGPGPAAALPQQATLIQQATRPAAWRDWFAALGPPAEHPYRGPLFDQFSMVTAAAAAGLGVALVPRFLVEEELGAGHLVVLLDRPVRTEEAYHLVVPTEKRSDPLVAAFRDWIVTEARGRRPAGPPKSDQLPQVTGGAHPPGRRLDD